MRLVCPNCEAKYEVPEDAIPETGRDVQCANCGHAWFQMRSRAPLAETTSAPVVASVAAPAPAHEPSAEPARDPVIGAERAAGVGTIDDSTRATDPIEEPSPEDPAVAEPLLPEPVGVLADEIEDVASVEEPAAVVADAEVAVAEESLEMAAADGQHVAVDPGAETRASVEAPVEISAEVPAIAEEVATVASVGAVPAIEAAVVESVIAEEAAETAVEAETAELAEVAAPAAYAVDESVLAILREEAERETQARRAEAAKPLETQTDLGIETAIPSKPVEIAPVAAAEATRRTRLPDVEEINSTLRPTETAGEEGMATEAAPAESRSSFRSGFLLVLTVAILGSALYGSADALASAVPSLAGPLKAYVSFVDSLRLHLDGLMQSATVAINGN